MRSSSDISKQSGGTDCKEERLRRDHNCFGPGEILVIGIGPGDESLIAPMAIEAMKKADVVAGYKTYLDLITPYLEGKEVIGTGMMQEVARCEAALEAAIAGKKVVVVSSGDAGVYAMAGLVLELALEVEPEKRPLIQIVPGISAVNAAAALLGAPLMHDFAVISLSDLMTSWDVIEKRLHMAAEGDFVVALYNPKSKKRTWQIEKVQEIFLQCRAENTPVGIVRQAYREEQSVTLSTLKEFTKEEIDMFSLVMIGNSKSFVQDGFFVTPRGYSL